jgi:hypothetical protein
MIGVDNAFIILIGSEASFNKLVRIFDTLPPLSPPSPEDVGHVDERLGDNPARIRTATTVSFTAWVYSRDCSV